jgi:hypothetical protein
MDDINILTRVTASIEDIKEVFAKHAIVHFNARQLLAIVYTAHCAADNVPPEVSIGMIHKELLMLKKGGFPAHEGDCPLCDREVTP